MGEGYTEETRSVSPLQKFATLKSNTDIVISIRLNNSGYSGLICQLDFIGKSHFPSNFLKNKVLFIVNRFFLAKEPYNKRRCVMKKICVAIAICLMVSGLFLPRPVSSEENDNPVAKVQELRSEISLINLVNGLNFTEEQLNQLIGTLKEVQTLITSYKEKGKALAAEALEPTIQFRQALIEHGPNYPAEIQKTGNKAENLSYVEGEKLREELQAKLPAFQEKIEAILTEAQKEVIRDFKPCFFPPKNQKNPVRVGQSANYEQAINLLRQIRQIPPAVYEEKRKETLQRQFKKFENKHGKLTDEEKAQEEKRLFALIDETRSMTAEEFELNKEDLAKEFVIKDKREELSKELTLLTEYRDKDKPRLNVIGRYFLNPKMLGVLEIKLTVLKNFKPPEPVDLDKVTPKDEGTKKK